jgi:antitoxin component HigA of HigAB toxin-antitoxin module
LEYCLTDLLQSYFPKAEAADNFTVFNIKGDLATPRSILLHLMEEHDLKQADLVGIIGSRGVVSEVVNGKQDISKAQASALSQLFHVDVGLFIG